MTQYDKQAEEDYSKTKEEELLKGESIPFSENSCNIENMLLMAKDQSFEGSCDEEETDHEEEHIIRLRE